MPVICDCITHSLLRLRWDLNNCFGFLIGTGFWTDFLLGQASDRDRLLIGTDFWLGQVSDWDRIWNNLEQVSYWDSLLIGTGFGTGFWLGKDLGQTFYWDRIWDRNLDKFLIGTWFEKGFWLWQNLFRICSGEKHVSLIWYLSRSKFGGWYTNSSFCL